MNKHNINLSYNGEPSRARDAVFSNSNYRISLDDRVLSGDNNGITYPNLIKKILELEPRLFIEGISVLGTLPTTTEEIAVIGLVSKLTELYRAMNAAKDGNPEALQNLTQIVERRKKSCSGTTSGYSPVIV